MTKISSDKKKSTQYLSPFCKRSDAEKFRGRVFEWLLIEILVFVIYLGTMLILMFKSRSTKVGIDNSGQFEPVYMRILAEKIRSSIDLKIEFAEEFYVDKERIVQVENVALKIGLTKEAFHDIKTKKALPNEESTNWIKKQVVGNISKSELDEERRKETNALDMMQNTSIIYHTESILEMQITCLVLCYYFTNKWATTFNYGTKSGAVN